MFRAGVLAVFAGALCGCAVHYGDARSGVETAWGVGRLTWAVEPLAGDCARVSSGTRLPGLVLGVGPDFLGVSLGYHVRERLQVVATTNAGAFHARVNGKALAADTGQRWGIGRLSLRTPAEGILAIISGRAGAGAGFGFERGRPAASVGWQVRQFTTLGSADLALELTQPAAPWPHFNYPATELVVAPVTNLTLKGTEP